MSRVRDVLVTVLLLAALLAADLTAAGIAVVAFTSWEQGTTVTTGDLTGGHQTRGDP